MYDLRLLWTTHLSLLHYTPKFAPIRGGDKSKRRTATGRIGGHAATHPLDPHMRFRAAAAPFLPPHAADHSERRSDRRSGLKSAAWVGLSRPEGGGLVIKPAVDPVGPQPESPPLHGYQTTASHTGLRKPAESRRLGPPCAQLRDIPMRPAWTARRLTPIRRFLSEMLQEETAC